MEENTKVVGNVKKLETEQSELMDNPCGRPINLLYPPPS